MDTTGKKEGSKSFSPDDKHN